MPSRVVLTQAEKALTAMRSRGIARLSELMAAGVSQETVARLTREGRITRLARGLYQLPEADLQTESSKCDENCTVKNGHLAKS